MTPRAATGGLGGAVAAALLAAVLLVGTAVAVGTAGPGRAQSTTTTTARSPINGQTCVRATGTEVCIDVGDDQETTTTTSPADDDEGDDGSSGDGSGENPQGAFDPGAEEDTTPCPSPPVPPPPSSPPVLRMPPELGLVAGETGSIPVHLDMPPRPTPVDVFFLVDTSGSMGDGIDGLRQSIASAGDELRAAGIDVWVGLAEFSDRALRPYRRLVPLGPLDCRMERALVAIRTSGGTEPHLLALHQAVSGAGASAVRNGWAVPRGRGATFRPGALHLVFHATDEPVRTDVEASPSRSRVAAAFAAASAKHVGIHALDGTTPEVEGVATSETRRSLDAMAVATKSFAPAGGIDCTGDGTVDLDQGQPLTCAVGGLVVVDFGGGNSSTFGRIASQVVQALRSTTDVTLRVVGTDVAALGATLGTPVRALDLAAANSVDDSLTVRCPTVLGAGAAPRRDVAVEAVVAGTVVARGATTVTCTATPALRRGRSPLGVAIAPATAPVVQPVQAPAPANAPAAATAVASAPAPSPVVGLAVAPESQPQLAFQEAQRSNGGDDSTDDAVRSLGAAGVFAGAAALARRRRTAPAGERRRRP